MYLSYDPHGLFCVYSQRTLRQRLAQTQQTRHVNLTEGWLAEKREGADAEWRSSMNPLFQSSSMASPESMGMVAGLVYFILLLLLTLLLPQQGLGLDKLAHFLGAMLSLLSMVFLGFADDVLDIRWRVKIWLPVFASIPLLTIYHLTSGITHVVVPVPLVKQMGMPPIIDLGPLYYVYMCSLCVFCTNSINILAGVNGVEGGQSLVIAFSLLGNSVWQVRSSLNPITQEVHWNSIYFLVPFIGVVLGYLRHNWYPAKCFGGDTFAYFAGMTFAVVSIQNHFTKTTLMLMAPQVFNFIYSCPQLFHFVECPRHRMPRLNLDDGLIYPSRSTLEKTGKLGMLMIKVLAALSLVDVEYGPVVGIEGEKQVDNYNTSAASAFTVDPTASPARSLRSRAGKKSTTTASSKSLDIATTTAVAKSNERIVSISNLTLINIILVKRGPMREDILCLHVMGVQVLAALITFGIRYGPLVALWYPK